MAETEADTGDKAQNVNFVASTDLPKWRSHKEVGADKIIDITRAPASATDTGILWKLKCGRIINPTRDLIARGEPVVGDYYVEYADGYQSWSPASAFEEGYTEI